MPKVANATIMMTYSEIVCAVEEGLVRQKQPEIPLPDFYSRLDRFKHFDYTNLSDQEIFWIITYVSFFALGVSAAIIERSLPRLEPYFGDYKKLSVLSELEINKLYQIDFKPRYITLRDLVDRCIQNSKTYDRITTKYGNFQFYLKEQFGITGTTCSDNSLLKLHAELKRMFAGIGEKASWHIITELGFNSIKPDAVITRIFKRIGLVGDSDGDWQIIHVGRSISTELSLPIRYIDVIFVKYGQVGKSDLLGTVDGICTEKSPKCSLCGLSSICNYRKASDRSEVSPIPADGQVIKINHNPTDSQIQSTKERAINANNNKEYLSLAEFSATSRYSNYSDFIKEVVRQIDKMLDSLGQGNYRIRPRGGNDKRFTFISLSPKKMNLITFTPSNPIDIEIRERTATPFHKKIRSIEDLTEVEQRLRNLLNQMLK